MPKNLPPSSTGRLQGAARKVVRPLMNTLFRLEVSGTSHVPRSGPAILSPNHDAMWDAPVLAVASPRRVLFMSHPDVFATAWKAAVFREIGGFPVSTGSSSLRSALAVLRVGRVLGLFPEGTRLPDGLGDFHSGAAWLALSTGAPLVPVAIRGTAGIVLPGSLFPRPRVSVRFGPAIEEGQISRGSERRRRAPELTEELRSRIAAMLAT